MLIDPGVSMGATVPDFKLPTLSIRIDAAGGPDPDDLVRFAASYLAQAVRREEFDRVLNAATACWLYAVGGLDARSKLLGEVEPRGPGGREEVRRFFEGMEARHRKMFPWMHARPVAGALCG